MLRIDTSSHGESRIRLLRLVRRGDRHDPRDLTVSCRFEGAFADAFREGRAEGLVPGEALKNLVHAAARQHGGGEIESFALALSERLVTSYPRISLVRVDIAERAWARVDAGGKPQGQAFLAGPPETRTTTVTNNGSRVSVVSGLADLTLMRTWGFSPDAARRAEDGAADGFQRLLVGTMAARWTYGSGDVTFKPYRQGVRAAVVETFAWHPGRSVEHTLYAIAEVVLATYLEISDVTLTFHERPYRPADLFASQIENPDDVFVTVDEPLGVVEVRVARQAEQH